MNNVMMEIHSIKMVVIHSALFKEILFVKAIRLANAIWLLTLHQLHSTM
jgi:hypothetical protein